MGSTRDKSDAGFGSKDLFGAHAGLQAQDWPPDLLALRPAWRPLVQAFFESPEGQELIGAIRERLQRGEVIYPPRPLRLLELLEPSEVRVVILGQDPYHGPHQAEGLAFSVAHGLKAPPSLMNIFKELRRDLGYGPFEPQRASLMPWVRQGVFLLNQTLSVEDARPASHANLPWSNLTREILRAITLSPEPCVFMLWGMHAQRSQTLIEHWAKENKKEVLILTCNHPSPLSALKGEHPFIGCGHFGLSQRWLTQRGLKVEWTLDEPGA